MPDVIRTKPHHFVDIITAYGAGNDKPQPHPYGHDVHGVTARALANRDVALEMELGADDICTPCVHNVGGLCDDTIETAHRPGAPTSKREWNLIIDHRWCERLQLAQGDRLTTRQFCQRVQQHAGDITDIYREEPAANTAERQRKLEAGLARFLSA